MFNNFYRQLRPAIRQMMYYNGHSDYILDCDDGDVNGDRIRDSVCTVGHRPGDLQSPFVEDIAVLIQDGATHKYTRIPLKESQGYNPTVFLGDFTKDGVDDILVSIDSGGSGGFSYEYVYSFLDNKAKLLFDSEAYSQELEYEVSFMDNYKVEVISKTMNTRYIIDISDKGAEYLSELYNPNGTLKENIDTPFLGEVIPLGNVYPVDYERDRVYDLNMIQRVIGKYNADTLAWVQTLLVWDGEKFAPERQELCIFGSELM
ncbi:MAG: hypothetical protein K0R84_242 [Clostridia bacterium]|nr:hypothetical protein [Clostridia bacterium]